MIAPGEPAGDLAAFLASLPPALALRETASFADVAPRVRADLALAIKNGVIPTLKVSVRSPHHGSLKVEITEWSGAVFSDRYTEALMDHANGTAPDRGLRRSHLAPALLDALDRIERIAQRHNYDNSRIEVDHFDVGYYLTVTASAVEALAAQAIRAEMDPAFVALQGRAKEAAAKVGPACTKATLGRGGLDAANEWALNRLIKLAARSNGRPLVYDKQRRGWVADTLYVPGGGS